MTAKAAAIEPVPSLWVERLVDVAVPAKGSPQRSEEQLQARHAMPLSRAPAPRTRPPGLEGAKAGDEAISK